MNLDPVFDRFQLPSLEEQTLWRVRLGGNIHHPVALQEIFLGFSDCQEQAIPLHQ